MSISTNFKVSYQCSECGQIFDGKYFRGDFYYHMVTVHHINFQEEKEGEITSCEFCGCKVASTEYTHHILRRHPEEQ